MIKPEEMKPEICAECGNYYGIEDSAGKGVCDITGGECRWNNTCEKFKPKEEICADDEWLKKLLEGDDEVKKLAYIRKLELEISKKGKVSDFTIEGIKNWVCLQEDKEIVIELIKFCHKKLNAIENIEK